MKACSAFLIGFVSLVMVPFSAFAASEGEMSSVNARDISPRTYIGDEMVGIKPQIGFVNYTDSLGASAVRMTYGISAEYNMASALGIDFTRWFIGPQMGAAFSHLGNPSSGAFGGNVDVNTGEGGANLLILPINAKAGFAPLKWMRLSAHGGGNVVYRSIVSAISMGDDSRFWRLLPNAGADLDLAFGHGVNVSLRPDWTFTNGDSMFNASLALGIALN